MVHIIEFRGVLKILYLAIFHRNYTKVTPEIQIANPSKNNHAELCM